MAVIYGKRAAGVSLPERHAGKRRQIGVARAVDCRLGADSQKLGINADHKRLELVRLYVRAANYRAENRVVIFKKLYAADGARKDSRIFFAAHRFYVGLVFAQGGMVFQAPIIADYSADYFASPDLVEIFDTERFCAAFCGRAGGEHTAGAESGDGNVAGFFFKLHF